jgi:hypothetical protein
MFFHVLKCNNIGFPVKEKLIKSISVGEFMHPVLCTSIFDIYILSRTIVIFNVRVCGQ